MANMQTAIRVWPGLERLWLRGDFHALLVAILFGWVLTFSFLASFVWPEWVASYLGRGWVSGLTLPTIWLSLAVSMLVSIAKPTVMSHGNIAAAEKASLQAFVEAQEHYLQANYFEAEQRLRKNLRVNPADMESMLLLISVLRRGRRLPEALEFVADMERLEAATPWLLELKAEKESCLRLKIQSLPPAHE